MHHLVAFRESVDPGNAFVNINAVADQALFTSGDDVRVPEEMANIIGAAALINDASGARARIESPSLRSLVNIDVEPIVLAAVFGSPPEALFHPRSPVPLVGDEAINFAALSDPAAGVEHVGLVWLADGPQQPVDGTVYTVRATSTVAQAAGVWTVGPLVFSQTLPAGRYQIAGWVARSTDAIAARLVFPGGRWRPGVPCINAIGDRVLREQRYGGLGVFGEFDHLLPPQVEVLGGVAAAQVHLFDLIKVG